MISKAKQMLANQMDELVASLQETIRFNTEKAPAQGDAPFGVEIKKCLEYVLNLGESLGFSSYNCDNYAGHVDFAGKGSQVLGILGHLDVVPSKAEEWKYPPYGGEIHDGKLFGRGTMDDKGPMIACLFALKALKDAGFEPDKTIRLIFGCDEESGMQCVRHYFTKQPKPDVAFSPDGDFPVINREKGIFQFQVVCGKLPKGVTINAGERANVVPSLCVATIPMGEPDEQGNVSTIELRTYGKSAHGSTPDEGINATHAMLETLSDKYPDCKTLQFVYHKVCDTTGKAWGIGLHDQESGNLTCNLGVLRTAEDGTLTITVDIRFPVSYTCEQMHKLLADNTPAEFTIANAHASAPLFVPSDSKLVSTLMSIYNNAMDVNLEPLAIGGGTYSRCLPNCVAFGPLFPGEEQTIHMPNECIDLNSLKLMTEIYMEAIYELAK